MLTLLSYEVADPAASSQRLKICEAFASGYGRQPLFRESGDFLALRGQILVQSGDLVAFGRVRKGSK